MPTHAFRGGEALRKKLDDIARNLGKGGTLKVGFLGDTDSGGEINIPTIAAIQEFGAPNVSIPPRPYFRNMIKNNESHWGDDIGKLLVAFDYDVEKALGNLGADMVIELQQSIIGIVDPPLSKITLMLRKMRAEDPDLVVTGSTVGEAAKRVAAGKSSAGVSTKPLVDTGAMLGSVHFDVET